MRTSATAESPLGTRLDRYEPANPATFPTGLTLAGATESLSTAPPASLYGTTKTASEHLALEYGAMAGFPVWINRCSVMGGAGQFAHPAQGIFGFWVHAFREGRPLKYIGFDGLGHQSATDSIPATFFPSSKNRSPSLRIAPSGHHQSRRRAHQLGPPSPNSAPVPDPLSRFQNRDSPSRGHSAVRAFDLPWFLMDNTRALNNGAGNRGPPSPTSAKRSPASPKNIPTGSP